jgi:zinc transport system substrate-binding protein
MNGLFRVIAIIIGVAFSYSAAEQEQNKNDKILLTSFYPMYIMAINVANGVPSLKVINMTKPQTGCLHDYQLTPQDMQSFTKAWAFIINGGGMESFIDKAVKQQPHLKIIDASKGIKLIRNDQHEEHGNDDIEHHLDEEFNPHVWVSVSAAIAQVKNIRDGLIALDSAHASIYRKNGDAYIARLERLKAKMHAGLANISSRNIITFHEAFPYFAREFSLNIVAVIEREPGTEPSAGELAETIKIVKSHKVKALFAEPQYPAKAAETIVRETGSKLYVLDPAVTGKATRDAYIQIMERNLSVLQKALR